MMSLKEKILKKLEEALTPLELQVIDESQLHAGHYKDARESHFKIIIKSSAFKGLSPLKRHRLVHDLLKEEIPQIHALSLNLQDS